jgi:hypothetical protein
VRHLRAFAKDFVADASATVGARLAAVVIEQDEATW